MSDLLVGLVEAIAGAVQAARERRDGPPTAFEPEKPAMPPMGQVARPAQPPPRPRVQPAVQAPVLEETPRAASDLAEALGDPHWLVRGFIIGEVLGRPIALRRQNPWDVDGVQ